MEDSQYWSKKPDVDFIAIILLLLLCLRSTYMPKVLAPADFNICIIAIPSMISTAFSVVMGEGEEQHAFGLLGF